MAGNGKSFIDKQKTSGELGPINCLEFIYIELSLFKEQTAGLYKIFNNF
jgi:hypothetical protein